MSATRVVLRNTAVQSTAEVLGKLGSLAVFAVMARRLGQEGFGEYTFALSLALVTTVVAGFGVDQNLTRTVARDAKTRPQLLLDSVMVNLAFGLLAIAVAVLITLGEGRPGHVTAAVAVLATACVVELLGKVAQATLQGLDDFRPGAASLLVQRYVTAALAVTAMLAGAGVLSVALAYLTGAVVGCIAVWRSLAARGVRLRGRPNVGRTLALASGTLPLGVTLILNTALFRIDALLLAALKGASTVGLYGAAYRLLESSLFVPYVFVAALLPTLARTARGPRLAEATQLGLKLVMAAMLPIAAVFVAFGEPIINLVYSSRFDGSVSPLRLLGGATALYGVSYLCSAVIIGQGRQRLLPVITAVALALNVALNLLLIPSYGANGAAVATSVSEAALAGISLVVVARLAGRLAAARVLASPVAGCLAVAVAAVVVGPTLAGLVIAAVACPLVILAVESVAYPDDAARMRGAIRPRVSVGDAS